MIIQDIDLELVPWHIKVFYAIDRFYVDEILDELIAAGCSGSQLRDSKKNLWESRINTGLTYSNLENKRSIMVIGLCSSAEEYYNSISHEKAHVVQHIVQSYGISPYGEVACYISGEISQKMFKKCKKLLCDCCRNKVLKRGE